MNVRPATVGDIPAMVALGVMMHAEAPRYRQTAFDVDKVRAMLRTAVSDGGCFVAEVPGAARGSPSNEWPEAQEQSGLQAVGLAAGVLVERFWSTERFATDLAVYVEPHCRGLGIARKLIGRLEDWARAQGAEELVLGISTGIHPEETAAFYESLGYKLSSVSLCRSLKSAS